MIRRYFPTFLSVIAIGSILFISQGVKIYTDWLWYNEIQEQKFFFQYLTYQWGMAIGAFLIVFVIIGLNLWLAAKLAPSRVWRLEGGILDLPLVYLSPFVTPFLWGIAVLLAFAAGTWGYASWQLPMLFFNGVPFGINDPIFNLDAAFYIFRLPYWGFLYNLGILAFIVSFIGVIVIYVISRNIGVTIGGLRISPPVLLHLSVLLAMILFVKGSGYLLQMYELLSSSHGLIWGPGYADLYGRIPLQKILFATATLGGVVTLLNVVIKSWKVPLAVFAVWGILSLTGISYPQFVQQFQVTPNELALEEPYIRHHIEMTRKAYQLDKIAVKQFIPRQTLTKESLKEEEGILKNVRLWDHAPLLATYAQLQEIRPYYKFLDVDIDRYVINGKLRQVMLSARELSHEHLQSRSWVNEHLVYTHGYGVVLSAVNQISKEGLPEFLIKDIPPVTDTNLLISRPEVYFGELANSYVLVNARQQEFDYPSGEENKYTHYQGTGGISIGGFWKRLIFSIRFSTLKLLLTSDITNESRIMYNRPIKERLERAFPLLVYDGDPYLVVHDGKLFWITDAYTVTKRFPYSAPMPGGQGNYVRNAVKALVDAYNGTVTLYISDPSDPLIQTYNKLFPGLFHDLTDMPAGLRSHLRYPEDFFKVQSEMYTLFHMKDPRVFYNKEDVWQFPHRVEEKHSFMQPYYAVMKFPGEKTEEFIQMIPFTPAKKDNLSAWMAARSDPQHYGELMVYLFPKQELVFGPMQIGARINQDPNISQLLTLWGQQGSSVIMGQLQVIPLGPSLLYIQPLYLKSNQGQLPELKRVIVAYGAAIAMEATLEGALKKVFEGEVLNGKELAPVITKEAVNEVNFWKKAKEHYDNAVKFQRDGNWSAYGEELRHLGDILSKKVNNKGKKIEEHE